MLAGILTGTAAFGYVFFTQNGDSPGSLIPNIGGDSSTAKLDQRVSFLLIGADKRPGETAFNADSLIVASVDPDTKIISMLSVPRDTRITLGGDTLVKINSVVMLRGIPELVKQVTEVTGIPLDGYVVTNFEGFKSIIDTLGGVNLYVEKDMKYETGDKVDGVINLKAGEQRLTGSQALQYARYRNDAMADIGRTARQQNVLKAVAKEMLQASTITKLPKLIPQFMEVVETDLSLMDMLKLSKVAASFDSSNIVSQTLPGVGLYLDGISFWEVNKELAHEIAQNLLLGITTDKVIDNMVMDLLDPSIKAHITVPGNSNDPNGTKSSGHDDKVKQETDAAPVTGPPDGQTNDPSPGPNDPVTDPDGGDTKNDQDSKGDKDNPGDGKTGSNDNGSTQNPTTSDTNNKQIPNVIITIN